MKFTNPNPVFRVRPLSTALVLATCLITTGCGPEPMTELENYINTTLATPAPAVESLCSQINCDSWEESPEYTNSDKRDPFKSFNVAGAVVTPPVPAPHPYPHTPEELEKYPLDSLRMVGMVDRDGRRWGLVQIPDGMILPIESGNYIGQNSGRVREIMEHQITLNEVAWTTNGWNDREAALALAEG